MKPLIVIVMAFLATVAQADSQMLHSTADISAHTPTGTPVKLNGEILQSLGEHRYLFRDRDGKVLVTLPGRLTADRPLPPGTRLIISGQVTQGEKAPRVDAAKLHSLKTAINPAASTLSY